MIARHIRGFFAAVVAALCGQVLVAIPVGIVRHTPDLVPEPVAFYFMMLGVLALMTLAVVAVVGIPTALVLWYRRKTALRHFIFTSLVMAIPVGAAWGWLMAISEPADADVSTYLWGLTLGLAMCVPSYITYWYVAARYI